MLPLVLTLYETATAGRRGGAAVCLIEGMENTFYTNEEILRW